MNKDSKSGKHEIHIVSVYMSLDGDTIISSICHLTTINKYKRKDGFTIDLESALDKTKITCKKMNNTASLIIKIKKKPRVQHYF